MRKTRELKSFEALKKDQSPLGSASRVSAGCDHVVAVPVLELCSGGCWVILSFTQEPVRVSRSGGTVSMSDTHKKNEALRFSK